MGEGSDGAALPRLVLGSRETGRGIDRRPIDVVMLPDGREIARYGSRNSGESLGWFFTQGRTIAHRTGLAVLPDDLVTTVERGGTPPFVSTVRDIRHADASLFTCRTADEESAWKDGWRYALKERGLLSARGRLKTA